MNYFLWYIAAGAYLAMRELVSTLAHLKGEDLLRKPLVNRECVVHAAIAGILLMAVPVFLSGLVSILFGKREASDAA